MKKNSRIIIGAVVVVVFAAVALYALVPSTTMYATLAEASKHPGQSVQIYGEPILDTIQYNQTENTFTVVITDKEGTRMPLKAKGKPDAGRMKEAQNLVIKGKYNNGLFHATEILYKCPSKYEKRAE